MGVLMVDQMGDFVVQQGLLASADPAVPELDLWGRPQRVTVVTFLAGEQGSEPYQVTLTERGLLHLTAVLEAALKGITATGVVEA